MTDPEAPRPATESAPDTARWTGSRFTTRSVREWMSTGFAKGLALALAAALFVVPVTLLLLRDRAEAQAVAAGSGSYVAPAVGSTSAPLTGPVIVVVGDESVTQAAGGVTAAERWPALVGAALRSPVDIVPAVDAGYATSGTEDITFVSAASSVASDADVILIVGGTHDSRVSAATLSQSAADAMTAAAQQAPGASVALVGPIVTGGLSKTQLVGVRSTIAAAARGAGVRWVDPASGWLPVQPATPAGLSTADEKRIAVKIEALVRRMTA